MAREPLADLLRTNQPLTLHATWRLPNLVRFFRGDFTWLKAMFTDQLRPLERSAIVTFPDHDNHTGCRTRQLR